MQCEGCGKEIQGKAHKTRKFCAEQCRRKYASKQFKELNPVSVTNNAASGKISEFTVCLDLLNKNFEVFSNVCQNGWCDFLVYKNKKYFLVEVTTGYYYVSGAKYNPKKYKKEKKWDVLAICYRDGLIDYIPKIEDAEISALFLDKKQTACVN